MTLHVTQPCRLVSKPAWSANISVSLEKLVCSSQPLPERRHHGPEHGGRDKAFSISGNVWGPEACLLSDAEAFANLYDSFNVNKTHLHGVEKKKVATRGKGQCTVFIYHLQLEIRFCFCPDQLMPCDNL